MKFKRPYNRFAGQLELNRGFVETSGLGEMVGYNQGGNPTDCIAISTQYPVFVYSHI